jgi:multidrug efflux pump subunit AcrA (membrane-fusion protein)
MEQNKTKWYKKPFTKASSFIARRPFASFLITLAALVGLVGIANNINKPVEKKQTQEKVVKEVTAYYLGSAPKIQTQGQIKKQGVITIQAQTAGIVQQIFKKEGEAVTRGTQILWISSNYQGGTLSSIQKQQAQASYNNNKDTFQTQKNAIAKQREIAEQNKDNTEQLRQITQRSVDETRGVIETNDEVLHHLIDNIRGLEASQSSQVAQIDQLKSQQAQLQSGINQLRTANRNAEYQVNTDNPPTKLAQLQHDLTLQQLDIQEKSLNLQLEISKFTYQVAQIGESLNYPASPFKGTVERINVTPGQLVNPGEVLATINTDQKGANIEAFVTADIAKQVSQTEPSIIYIGTKTVEVLPSYVSTQPTAASLYTIKYNIPEENVDQVDNASYSKIEIPLGTANTTNAVPFVPLDAIYQTQDGAYIYTAEKQNNEYQAKIKKVTLGQVSGNYVVVNSGLSDNDIIIIDRNVLEGDNIKLVNSK